MAIGERHAPSASTKAHATALPPWRWTTSLSPSSSERDISRAPALIARTTPPRVEHALEDLELRAAQRVGDVGDLQPEARVGPVGAEARHRLVVAHPRPGRRARDRQARDVEHLPHHRLHRVDHVVLVDERHLEVELGELGLAVGAQVLVAEAARDLEVPLVAGDHQDLLEQLRRLRQRVPGARLHPRGDEEVARALGRRPREVGRLDLQEVALLEHLAHRAHDPVAQDHRVAHPLAAQVDRAVLEAQRLVDRDLLVDRERRRVGLGQQVASRSPRSRSRRSGGSG